MKNITEGPALFKIKEGPLFIVESMPWLKSASIGFFFPLGSGHESAKLSGVTHFIEHMVFKGTKARSAKDIVNAFEGVGGVLNGSTGKEMMNIYGRIGSKYLKRGFTTIADMILNSKFLETDVNRERSVILEEIRMSRDIPDQYLVENFALFVWGKSSLARPIGGNEKSLENINQENMLDWFKGNFSRDKLVITAAGDVSHDNILEWWQKISGSNDEIAHKKISLKSHEVKPVKAKWHNGIRIYRRDVEQALIIFGFRAPSVGDSERYPFQILESILGGGMGARLFQQIREKAGLAYDIDTGFSPMRSTGVMTIDSQTSPVMLFKLADKILAELKKIRTRKPSNVEIKRVKDYLEGGMALGLESSSNRMVRNALSQIMLGQIISPDEVIRRLQSVTADDVMEMADKYFTAESAACGVLVPNDWEDDKNILNNLKEMIDKHLS